MRIKRLALLWIAAALLCTTAVYANAREDKFGLITALGIVDQEADRTKILTRGEAADMLSAFVDIPAQKASELFWDVTEEDKGIDAVAAARIMNGYGNGIFGINDPVSREQFTKAVVSMLGYGAMAEQRGGYPVGYTDTANRLGLLDGVSAGATEGINLEQAVCIVYNALEVKMLVPDNFNAGKFTVDDFTLLKDILKVDYMTGKVTANSETALSAGGKNAKEGEIRINDVLFKTEGSFDGYLGYNVKCYYRETDGDMYAVYMCAKDSTELILDSADIKSADFRKISYEKDGRQKYAAISAQADFIRNGKAAVISDAAEIAPEYGGLKLLDSDNNGEYDVVFIDSVIIRQASGTGLDGETISVKRRFGVIGLTSAGKVVIRKNGEEIKAEDIQKDDILCIRTDKEQRVNGFKTVAPDAEVIKITVIGKKVNGKVTELDYSDENKGFILLDKKKYRITPYLKMLIDTGKSDKLRIGQTVDLWLDEFGNAAEFSARENEEQYAYLLNAVYSYDEVETGKIRVINFYNEEEEYMLAEEFILDGQRKSKAPDLISALSDGGEVKAQLIYFTVNEDRLVNKIDTLRLNPQYETVKNSLIKSVPKQSYKYYYRGAGSNLGGKMIVDDNATVFVAPLNQNSRDAKDYAVYGASYFQNNNYYYADGYNFNDAETCKLFVAYYDKTQIEDTVGVAVVDKIVNTVNYDDEPVKMIYLYDGTGYGSYETASMSVEFINSTSTENLTLENLKKGDVIRYVTDRFGAIIIIEACHDADGEDKIGTNGTFTSTFRTTMGIAYDVGDGVMKVIYSDTGDTSAAELISLNSCKILRYDAEYNQLEEINSGEIVPYLSCNSLAEASRVFTYANKGNTSLIVVY